MKIFRRIALESCPTVHVGEAHDYFGELLSNRYVFENKKTFCFENSVFSHLV